MPGLRIQVVYEQTGYPALFSIRPDICLYLYMRLNKYE